jgi:hypothetical protein
MEKKNMSSCYSPQFIIERNIIPTTKKDSIHTFEGLAKILYYSLSYSQE